MSHINIKSSLHSTEEISAAFSSLSSVTAFLGLEAYQIDALYFHENTRTHVTIDAKNDVLYPDIDLEILSDSFSYIKEINGDWVRKGPLKDQIHTTRLLKITLEDYKSAVEKLNSLISDGKSDTQDANDLEVTAKGYLKKIDNIFDLMKQTTEKYSIQADLAETKLKETINAYAVKIQDQEKLSKIKKINREIDKLESEWAFNVVSIAGTGLILVAGVVFTVAAAPFALSALTAVAAMKTATAIFCAGATISVTSLFVAKNHIGDLVKTYQALEDKRIELAELRRDIAVLSGLCGIQVRVCNYLKVMTMQTDKICSIWKENIEVPSHENIEMPNYFIKKQINEPTEIIDSLLQSLEANLKALTTVTYKSDVIKL